MLTQRNLALALLVAIAAALLAVQVGQARPAVLSRWGEAVADQASAGLAGKADLLAGMALPAPARPAVAGLDAFNGGSALRDSAADGAVQSFRRALPGGGTLDYVVVRLVAGVHVGVISADGATPDSDAAGDTVWADGGRHLQPVAEMAAAPYAAREGMELVFAMAFGFHGDSRTSDEGSVVVDGVVHRVNAGRSTVCVTPDRRAVIGRFNASDLAGCAQAAGAGPIILWQSRVASLAADRPSDDMLPFNPLGEDFSQIDWRKKIYAGRYPKTAIGVGELPGGGHFLVLATAEGALGEEIARALREMGCSDALGGDDDTSTQAVWRGRPVWERPGRPVPDAVAVYVTAP
ncbi:phosphodiester glycosidase family protein [Oscillochloris sp. ZM17-4]|uniref:phosphodiester glycosidase family protein n=1 Tax=Oscillochloris sp. ZM17-4 TaxID=2866714 RepID=UPI001C73137A|nr:phosphodiester glycosidase family protein [Oscillochloris sp. ZM17-4]MBX0329854.1 phosphodiester glycosidase family protein [Oscillochloris sp. ZM17-4]